MKCATCGQAASKKCRKCQLVNYCNRSCQLKDWSKHKKMCKSISVFASNELPNEISMLTRSSISLGSFNERTRNVLSLSDEKKTQEVETSKCAEKTTEKTTDKISELPSDVNTQTMTAVSKTTSNENTQATQKNAIVKASLFFDLEEFVQLSTELELKTSKLIQVCKNLGNLPAFCNQKKIQDVATTFLHQITLILPMATLELRCWPLTNSMCNAEKARFYSFLSNQIENMTEDETDKFIADMIAHKK